MIVFRKQHVEAYCTVPRYCTVPQYLLRTGPYRATVLFNCGQDDVCGSPKAWTRSLLPCYLPHLTLSNTRHSSILHSTNTRIRHLHPLSIIQVPSHLAGAESRGTGFRTRIPSFLDANRSPQKDPTGLLDLSDLLTTVLPFSICFIVI